MYMSHDMRYRYSTRHPGIRASQVLFFLFGKSDPPSIVDFILIKIVSFFFFSFFNLFFEKIYENNYNSELRTFLSKMDCF